MQIITAAGMEITESQWPCILLQSRYLPAGKLSTLGCLAGWLDSLILSASIYLMTILYGVTSYSGVKF